MKSTDGRLRRLETRLLPPPETAESRELREIIAEAGRRRAARLGLPEPEDEPEPAYPPGMSLAETMRVAARRMHERRGAEEAGALR